MYLAVTIVGNGGKLLDATKGLQFYVFRTHAECHELVRDIVCTIFTESLVYMALQLLVSLGFVWGCGALAQYLDCSLVLVHWVYLICALVLLAVGYVAFKKKYCHLHETYLREIEYLHQNGLVQHSAGAKSEVMKD